MLASEDNELVFSTVDVGRPTAVPDPDMHMQIMDRAIHTSPNLPEGARPLTGTRHSFCSHWG